MKSATILRVATLLAAAASLAMSVWLYFQNDASIDDRLNGIFVGAWVPSILALGNFLITSDSDRKDETGLREPSSDSEQSYFSWFSQAH